MKIRCVLAAAAAAVLSLPLGAANSNVMTVQAVVLSKNVCRFTSPTSTLNFGTINPTIASPVTATVTLQYRCTGSSPIAVWGVTSNDGLHATGVGQPRMQHATNPAAFLAYTLSFPASGSSPRNTNLNLTVTGTVVPAAFATAPAGSYADTVTLSIVP